MAATNQQQRDRPSQPGTSDGTSTGGQVVKRQAPESKDLLANIEQAVKEKDLKQTFEVKKRRILERCGCL